ncbi:MAG TPA: phosphoribosylformylglycinamidine synthase subunit PurQ [Leptospiraceae bacterium]|nr:phosphoribosylformylglycinamidine synthase I [Spirochaetaceae bacterium]HBS06288.1 phosphoribosylformylglycinamidine synthase subunit PurQ [Leptospiraceae bacterium]|tara:strand:+ start:27834 stop:28493 length:660 start_codon:yes stop_codon:yes gene_type:complete
MKAGVITFPGSNCDRDIQTILENFFKVPTDMLWHADSIQGSYDLLVVPGGFSYGDYLRAGAIARFAPAMQDLLKHSQKGGYVLGICNGFQILCESHLLPGALIRNQNLKHICKDVSLLPESSNKVFGKLQGPLSIPVSHGEGNYRADEDTLKSLQDNSQIAFRYQDNPNGSIENIAGITSKDGRVMGMMPHPERATDPVNGKTQGKPIMEAILNSMQAA